MEKLSDLPTKQDTEMTSQESSVMQKYFNPKQTATGNNSPMNYKLIGYSILMFVLLANPWIDPMLAKLPFINSGESNITIFGVKILVFAIILFILYKFFP
jgi:hypothetical protein